MSLLLVYVSLPPYLAQWFVHEHGGDEPVKLVRGSVESKILEVFLTKQPEGKRPELRDEGTVAIRIPEFRYKSPETYNYLPARAMEALRDAIRSRFDVQLWRDLYQFGTLLSGRLDELIYAWMEAHGIDDTETNWAAVSQRFQRLRRSYSARERAKKNYKSKKTS